MGLGTYNKKIETFEYQDLGNIDYSNMDYSDNQIDYHYNNSDFDCCYIDYDVVVGCKSADVVVLMISFAEHYRILS